MNLLKKLTHPLALLLAFAIAGASLSAEDESPAIPEVPDQLDLPTILTFAAEHNFAIRSAKQNIEAQEGLILEVRAQALPTVSLNANYSKQDEGLTEIFTPSQRPTTETWGINVVARQPLYKGGGIRSAIDAQAYVREAAELALKSVINDALLEVKTRFYTVLLAREQIEVEQQNIELLETTLADTKKRFDAGAVSEFEVLRAEVLLANAKTPLIQRQTDFRVAIDQLREAMGYSNYRRDAANLEKIPELIGELDYTEDSFALAPSLETALEQRPELKRLQLIEKAREAGITNARSAYRPSVDVVASYGKRNSSFDRSFDAGPEGWVVGVEANWNIFDGFRRRGQVAQAVSAKRQSQIDREAFRLRVEVEVRQAFSAHEQAEQLVAAAAKTVQQAEEALRLADKRYSAGAISQLDVLEARVALTQARTNRLQANFQHLVATARLQRAIGQQ